MPSESFVFRGSPFEVLMVFRIGVSRETRSSPMGRVGMLPIFKALPGSKLLVFTFEPSRLIGGNVAIGRWRPGVVLYTPPGRIKGVRPCTVAQISFRRTRNLLA